MTDHASAVTSQSEESSSRAFIAACQAVPENRIVVERPPSDRQRVYFGARITLETETGAQLRYRIVGPDEFDMAGDYISMDAPLGKVLLGRRLDDEVALELATGIQRYTIVAVDYADIS